MPLSPSALQARLWSEGASPSAWQATAKEALRVAEEAREELATLRDCLVACRVVSRERLEAEKHRRHFQAAATCSSGWPGMLGATLEDLSRGPLTRIAGLLDPATGLQLRCVSPTVEDSCMKAAAMYGPCLYVWGGFTGERNLTSGESLDLAAGEWSTLPPLPGPLTGGACAAVGDKVYLVGGFDGRSNQSRAARFDPSSRKWEALPPMAQPRFGCGAADFGGCFCVCGGNNGQMRLQSVECFVPKHGAWTPLSPMATARVGAVVAATGGRLYACGGQDLDTAECLDRGRWVRLPPMSVRRFGSSGGACGGCIYVCGGKGSGQPNLDTAERFDPARNGWEAIPKMLTRRFGSVAASVRGRLYVFGGNDTGVFRIGGTRLASVECFCPETEEWEELPSMLEGRSGPCAAGLVRQALHPED